MMICPGAYYEELKGKSVDEVKLAIAELEQDIATMKASLKRRNACFKNPPYDTELIDLIEDDWLMCPSLETQISCAKQYLQEAIRALSELGEDYIPSKK